MAGESRVCRAFNAAIMSALLLGLVYEAAHAATHPPQLHTDHQERIEHKMIRLREAEAERRLPKAVARQGAGPGRLPALFLPPVLTV